MSRSLRAALPRMLARLSPELTGEEEDVRIRAEGRLPGLTLATTRREDLRSRHVRPLARYFPELLGPLAAGCGGARRRLVAAVTPPGDRPDTAVEAA